MHHAPPRLVSALRLLFGVFRGLSLVCLAVVPLGFAPFMSLHVRGTIFAPASATLIPVQTTGADRPTIRIERADVCIEGSRSDGDLNRLARYLETAEYAVAIVGFLLSSHLLWRLCQNVERGEVFCDANVRLLRRLGWIMIGFAVGLSALVLWKDRALATYIATHTATLSVTPMTAENFILHLQLSTAVLGLLTLVLTEIFRYGLALKRESELTV